MASHDQPHYTAMLLIIDRSVSMTDIRDDGCGGLNTMVTNHAVCRQIPRRWVQ